MPNLDDIDKTILVIRIIGRKELCLAMCRLSYLLPLLAPVLLDIKSWFRLYNNNNYDDNDNEDDNDDYGDNDDDDVNDDYDGGKYDDAIVCFIQFNVATIGIGGQATLMMITKMTKMTIMRMITKMTIMRMMMKMTIMRMMMKMTIMRMMTKMTIMRMMTKMTI